MSACAGDERLRLRRGRWNRPRGPGVEIPAVLPIMGGRKSRTVAVQKNMVERRPFRRRPGNDDGVGFGQFAVRSAISDVERARRVGPDRRQSTTGSGIGSIDEAAVTTSENRDICSPAHALLNDAETLWQIESSSNAGRLKSASRCFLRTTKGFICQPDSVRRCPRDIFRFEPTLRWERDRFHRHTRCVRPRDRAP